MFELPPKIVPVETMPHITSTEFGKRIDEITDRIEKENMSFVITHGRGKNKKEYVICPASWCVPVFDSDYGIIVIAAVRYAIGRATYMPGLVKDYVIRYMTTFDNKTLSLLERDIEWYLNTFDVLCDREVWIELKNAVHEELEKRNERKE